jgi:arabinogalactan oligomer / maltooligosaccharide transport system permease protein
MSVAERAEELAISKPKAVPRRLRGPKWFAETGWRHVVAISACLFALFPVAYVVSAAFNADQSLGGSSLIPRHVTLDNFRAIFRTTQPAGSEFLPAHYVRWFLNSMLIAGGTAITTVLLGALAAYAFSRFRFKGRRFGMLALLLIQMFPQLLAVVAIYLIVLRVGDVFPVIGLNKVTALIVVYLGGAMGVNTWLMKGFFDTIPSELDESARVDGATPAQIFWGIVLPLATPVLAVIALISFITTLNEYVIASVILQTTQKLTLPLGLYQYIDQQFGKHWGPFAAGVLLAAIPAALLFTFLQRYIVQGLTAGAVKG